MSTTKKIKQPKQINKTQLQKDFGLRLKALRKEQKLTQEVFAFQAELDKTYVASIEQGKRNVSLVNIAKITNALDITVSDFFNWVVVFL